MSAGEQQTFAARGDALASAIAFVEAFCERHGLAQGETLRLCLIVEELFTNTVTHGHGGDSDAPVRIALAADAAQLTLHYEDEASPFDPLQHRHARPIDLDAEIDSRVVGGLGIHLVLQLARHVEYRFVDGVNRLRVELARGD